MRKSREKGRAEGFIVGSIVGAVVASVTALLFTPKSGKELRKDINEGTNKALENVDDYLDVARSKGAEIVDDVGKEASSYIDLASGKLDEAVTKTKEYFTHDDSEIEAEKVARRTEEYYETSNDGQDYNTYQHKN